MVSWGTELRSSRLRREKQMELISRVRRFNSLQKRLESRERFIGKGVGGFDDTSYRRVRSLDLGFLVGGEIVGVGDVVEV